MITLGEADPSLLRTVVPNLVSAAVAAAVASAVYLAGRRQATIDLTLELHKEYYSDASGKARRKAERFLCDHWDADWAQVDPYDLPDPGKRRPGYSNVVRFLHRLAVLRTGRWPRVSRRLTAQLFSREIGWWFGLGLDRMAARTNWWTGPMIRALRDQVVRDGGAPLYLAGYRDGAQARLRNRRRGG